MRIDRDTARQDLSTQWRALGIDPQRELDRLLVRLERAFEPPSTLERLGVPSVESPGHPVGMLLLGGTHGDRLAAVLRPDKGEDMALVAHYPWLELGTQTTVRLRGVREWNHGLCARIDADVQLDDGGALPLSWFDPLYARDWRHYAALDDRPIDVILSALAIQIRIVEAGQSPADTDGLSWRSAGGLRLSAIDGAASDEWAFHGRLVSVEPTSLFDAAAWWARVAFADWRGGARTLRIAFSRAALDGRVPVAGDEVVGFLCLQGWLWGPA